MKLLLLFLILGFFIPTFGAVLAQTSPPAQLPNPNLNNIQLSGIFNKLSDIFNQLAGILGKIILPLKEIIKFLGNALIWVLELMVKLIQWGLAYLH